MARTCARAWCWETASVARCVPCRRWWMREAKQPPAMARRRGVSFSCGRTATWLRSIVMASRGRSGVGCESCESGSGFPELPPAPTRRGRRFHVGHARRWSSLDCRELHQEPVHRETLQAAPVGEIVVEVGLGGPPIVDIRLPWAEHIVQLDLGVLAEAQQRHRLLDRERLGGALEDRRLAETHPFLDDARIRREEAREVVLRPKRQRPAKS